MKVITLVFSLLALVSIGFGQDMTLSERKAQVSKANWVVAAVNVEKEKPLYVDSKTIRKDVKHGVVIFEVRNHGTFSGYTYLTVFARCNTASYIFTNVFAEQDGVISKEGGTSDVAVAEKDSVMWHILSYVCKAVDKS